MTSRQTTGLTLAALLIPCLALAGVEIREGGRGAVLDNGMVMAHVEILQSAEHSTAVTTLRETKDGGKSATLIRSLESSLDWPVDATFKPVEGLAGPAVQIVGLTRRHGEQATNKVAELFLLPAGSRHVVVALMAEPQTSLQLTSSWNEGFDRLASGEQRWLLRDLFQIGGKGRRLLPGQTATLSGPQSEESVAWASPDGARVVSVFSWDRTGPRPLRVMTSQPGGKGQAPSRLLCAAGWDVPPLAWPEAWKPDLAAILVPAPIPTPPPKLALCAPTDLVLVGEEATIKVRLAEEAHAGDAIRFTVLHAWEDNAKPYSVVEVKLSAGDKEPELKFLMRRAIVRVRAEWLRGGQVIASAEDLVNTGNTLAKPVLMGPQNKDIVWPTPPKGNDWGKHLFIAQMDEGGNLADGLRLPEYVRVLLKCGADLTSFTAPRGEGFGPHDDSASPLGAEWRRLTGQGLVLQHFEQWQFPDELGRLYDENGRDMGPSWRERCPNHPRTLANYACSLRRFAQAFGPSMPKFNGRYAIDWMEEGEGHWASQRMTCYCRFCANRFREWLWDRYGDEAPGRDTNGNGRTMNSECRTAFVRWADVQPPLIFDRALRPRFWTLWCRFRTDSMLYVQADLPHAYAFENFVCAGGWPAMGPGLITTSGNLSAKCRHNNFLGYDGFDCMDTWPSTWTSAGVTARFLRKYPEKRYVWMGTHYAGGWADLKDWDQNFWRRLVVNQWGRIGRFGATVNSMWWDLFDTTIAMAMIRYPDTIEHVSWMNHTLEKQAPFLEKLLPVRTTLAVYFPWESYVLEPYMEYDEKGKLKDGTRPFNDWGLGYTLAHAGYQFDVLYPEDVADGDLQNYEMLVVPSGPWVDDGVVAAVKKFMAKDGKLVLIDDALTKELDGKETGLRQKGPNCVLLPGDLLAKIREGDRAADLPPRDGSLRQSHEMSPFFMEAAKKLSDAIGQAGKRVRIAAPDGGIAPNVILGAQEDAAGTRFLLTLTENRGVPTRVRLTLPPTAKDSQVVDLDQAAVVANTVAKGFEVDVPPGGWRILAVCPQGEAAGLLATQHQINQESRVFPWYCSRHFFVDLPPGDMWNADAYVTKSKQSVARALIVLPDNPTAEDRQFAEILRVALLLWPMSPPTPEIPVRLPAKVSEKETKELNLLLVGTQPENSLLARLLREKRAPDPGSQIVFSYTWRPYWFGGNVVVIQGQGAGKRAEAFAEFYRWFVMYYGGRCDYHPSDVTYASAAANLAKLQETLKRQQAESSARANTVARAKEIEASLQPVDGWESSGGRIGKTSLARSSSKESLVVIGNPDVAWNGCLVQHPLPINFEAGAGRSLDIRFRMLVPEGAHANRLPLQIRFLSGGQVRCFGLPAAGGPKGQWCGYQTSFNLPTDFQWERVQLELFVLDDENAEHSGGPVVIDELYSGIENGPNLISGAGTRPAVQ